MNGDLTLVERLWNLFHRLTGGRVVLTSGDAFMLGCGALSWRRRWRFLWIATENADGSTSPFRLHFLAGRLGLQLNEFFEGSCT